MSEHHLDCRDLKCPMPIVKLAMTLRALPIGDVLFVEATDPAFLADVRAWSRMSGQELGAVADGDVKRVEVRKVRA